MCSIRSSNLNEGPKIQFLNESIQKFNSKIQFNKRGGADDQVDFFYTTMCVSEVVPFGPQAHVVMSEGSCYSKPRSDLQTLWDN